MQLDIPLVDLPRPVPDQRWRPCQENIPPTRPERERLKQLAGAYVEAAQPVPPLSLEELRAHCDAFIALHGLEAMYRDYLAILINNATWRDALASVPYDRRLLLLPKCLRVEDKCPAPFDEFGLLCKQCGLCSIQDLQNEAERLGYACLVAEGSAIVMALIQTGKIDAIVGVSCLNVLERAFPYMEAAAIPGIAIPLLQDDCKDTNVDIDWVWDLIHLTSDDKTYRLNLDALRREVEGWFEPDSLDEILGVSRSETERIGRDWLRRAGKRWRPFLTVCAFKAFQEDPDAPLPAGLRQIAVAIECFHKASLIHDDIEDADVSRYDQQTLHAEYGVPVALNVGDLLIGEGYRLLADSDAPAEMKVEMLRAASAGHRTLCLGQGAELCWDRQPEPLTSLQVIDIFRRKTAPAFEVALRLGVTYAGTSDARLIDVLNRYSEALGIAYQIRDDLEDLTERSAPGDLTTLRPWLPLAIACEKARGDSKALLTRVWERTADISELNGNLTAVLQELKVEDRCRQLLEAYKEEAVRALVALENPSLKGLLRRVIGKIFSLEVKGWCSEFEARNAVGAPAAHR